MNAACTDEGAQREKANHAIVQMLFDTRIAMIVRCKKSVQLPSELPADSLNTRQNALTTRDIRAVEAEERRERHLRKSLDICTNLSRYTTIDITTIDITTIDIKTIDGVRDVGRWQVGVAQREWPLGPCCTLYVKARRRTERHAPSLMI